MQFDPSHPFRLPSGISEATAGVLTAVRAMRRTAGLNVQFINESGRLDEWSFASTEHRDAFLARIAAEGRPYAISR